MKTTLRFLSFILMSIGLLTSSCSKEGDIGPIGPQGEQGIQGEQGPAGEDGEQGPAGEDGNANVITSDWLEPIESDYSVNQDNYKSLPLSISNYNENKDLLLVYYYDQLGTNLSYSYVHLLPHHNFHNDGEGIDKSITIDIRPTFFTISVKINSYDRNLLPREYLWEPDASNPDNNGVRFRYIIIPPNTATGKAMGSSSVKNSFENKKKELSNIGVDIDDYYAVCDYYGIEY